MRRTFNLNNNPGAPLPIIPITIHKSGRSNNDKLKKNGLLTSSKYSKFLIRNLPEEHQKEARQRLDEFINQRSEGIDATFVDSHLNESADLSMLLNDIRNRKADSNGHEVPPPSKYDNRTKTRKAQALNDYQDNEDHRKVCSEGFAIPQVPRNIKRAVSKRKHPSLVPVENKPIRRRVSFSENSDVAPKKNVCFSDTSSEPSNTSFLKSIENIETREPFLRDSINTLSTEDLLCTEISPVSKMIEKRKTGLNDAPLRLTSQRKRKREIEWNGEKLKIVANNVSEAIPPLTLGNKTSMTYDDALKTAVKKMFSNFRKPNSTSSSLRKVPDPDISAQFKSIFDATSPFVTGDIKVPESQFEETLNFDITEPLFSDELDIDFENQMDSASISPDFFNTTGF